MVESKCKDVVFVKSGDGVRSTDRGVGEAVDEDGDSSTEPLPTMACEDEDRDDGIPSPSVGLESLRRTRLFTT